MAGERAKPLLAAALLFFMVDVQNVVEGLSILSSLQNIYMLNYYSGEARTSVPPYK